jgi:(p)ppGpp synthase/HD superfamily hydrolase
MAEAEETLTHPLSPLFHEALVYAATLHRDQSRKGTQTPYVAHLLGVASLVLEHGGTEEEAIAALLHDSIEDQGIEHAPDIERRFGPAVYAIVAGCSDAAVTKGATKPPWRARKEAYVAHIAKAGASTRLVSAADKLYNARAVLSDYREIGEKLWERFSGGRDSLWYYRALVTALREHEGGKPEEHTTGLRRLVDELDRVVSELERAAGATVG